jgi:hypothetical protein
MQKEKKPIKRESLLAEPGKARCKECGATYHYPVCPVPLLDFVTDVFHFYEAHEHCHEGEAPAPSYYPPLPLPSFVEAICAQDPAAKAAWEAVPKRKDPE